jgi:hypothetical protein
MSQLSFADVFNMARETADNSPVIQAGQQMKGTHCSAHDERAVQPEPFY